MLAPVRTPTGLDHEPTLQEHRRVEDLRRRFGTNPNSIFLRYPGAWRYWFGSEVEGVVAFVLAGRTAIVWSDPLCAPDDAFTLLGAFLDQARHARLRVALLALDETVARAAMDRGCSVLAIGMRMRSSRSR